MYDVFHFDINSFRLFLGNSIPILTDGDFFLTPLSSTLFPGIDSSIQVHSGFGESQAEYLSLTVAFSMMLKHSQSSTAADVLAAVKTAISKYSATRVTMVGHSLGLCI